MSKATGSVTPSFRLRCSFACFVFVTRHGRCGAKVLRQAIPLSPCERRGQRHGVLIARALRVVFLFALCFVGMVRRGVACFAPCATRRHILGMRKSETDFTLSLSLSLARTLFVMIWKSNFLWHGLHFKAFR